MEENFLPSLEKVLRYEGGFTNHPLDKGGPTNLGITLTTLKNFYNEYDYGDIDEDGDITIEDIKALTPDSVAPIYKKYYWDKMRLDEFPGGIDFLMFDFGVNSGPRNAIKILQRAINRALYQDVLAVDGVIGDQTLMWVRKIDTQFLIDAMIKEREIFYRKLIYQNPSQEVFAKGWFRRLSVVSREVNEFV